MTSQIKTDFVRDIERLGRFWLRGHLSGQSVETLKKLCSPGGSPGIRLSANPLLSPLIGEAGELGVVMAGLGFSPAPVRLLAFDKSADANWSLPWHQDRVIAVSSRCETPGYGNWSRKDGLWHCEPPVDLLSRMVFVRIHLGEATQQNGALELALGSHRSGRIATDDVAQIVSESETEICEAAPGDVLIVAALMLHRSGRAIAGGSRLALRLDYARRNDLSPSLCWAM